MSTTDSVGMFQLLQREPELFILEKVYQILDDLFKLLMRLQHKSRVICYVLYLILEERYTPLLLSFH